MLRITENQKTQKTLNQFKIKNILKITENQKDTKNAKKTQKSLKITKIVDDNYK